jgi:predicted amidohydrolase
MKVALLQFCAGTDKTANLSRALTLSREAIGKKTQFILLPEVFNFRGDARDKESFARATERIPGPSTDAFVPLAKKHKVSFLLGSILEKAPCADGRDKIFPIASFRGSIFSSRPYNSSVFIGPQGVITAKYRKIHLFDARMGNRIIKEEDCFRAGTRLTTVKIGEFRAGLSICYDLRFPELYQNYARRGVEILTVPSCFTRKTGEAHWETLLRARAIENLAYVLAPNQVGMDERGLQAYGHSMIISPWGEVIARGSGSSQEIIFGDINIEEVRKARRKLPGIIKYVKTH